MSKHPYSDILHAIADGKAIQWKDRSGNFRDQSVECTLAEIIASDPNPSRYRVKPSMIAINGIECEAPMPVSGSAAWIKLQTFDVERFVHFSSPQARDAAFAAVMAAFVVKP